MATMIPWLATGRSNRSCATRFPTRRELAVEDRTGGGDHFQVTIASGRFDGLSLVEQHRLVYEALAAPLGRRVDPRASNQDERNDEP